MYELFTKKFRNSLHNISSNNQHICFEAIDAGKLPTPICFLHSYYDGGQSDEIYRFGGVAENDDIGYGNNNNIYSFNISSNTIKAIGEIPSDIELFSSSYVIRSSKSDSSQNLLLLYYFIPQYLKNVTLILSVEFGTSTWNLVSSVIYPCSSNSM